MPEFAGRPTPTQSSDQLNKPGSHKRLAIVLAAAVAVIGSGGLWYGMAGGYCRARALASMSSYRYREAAQWLDAAAFWQSASGETELLKARLDRKRGRFESMQRQLERCRGLQVPETAIELEILLSEAQTGDLVRIRQVLPELLTDPQADLQEICGAYVNGCLAEYRLEDAVQIIELWMADFPDDPEPHYLFGRICEHTGKYRLAEESYRTAMRLGSGHGPAACNLGRLLVHELNRPEDALNVYELAALELEQPQPALCGAAQCLIRLERLDEARQRLDQALALPDEHLDEAFRLVGESAESAAAQLLATYGRLEIAAGNPNAAAEWLGRAVEANPLDWKGRYSLVQALQASGREKEAAPHAHIVDASGNAMAEMDALLSRVRDEPDNADIRCRLGEIFLEYVSEQQGVVWLNSALQIDPQHAGAHAALAKFYESRAAVDERFRALAEMHRRFVPERGEE